jgi:hypothetical protein
VIPVTVRDVHRREVPSVRSYPLGQLVGLAHGEQRVDEDGVALAGDKRRRYRRPERLLFAWTRVAAGCGLQWRYMHVPAE